MSGRRVTGLQEAQPSEAVDRRLRAGVRRAGARTRVCGPKASAAAFRFRGAATEVHGRRAILHEPSPPGWPWRTVPRLADSETPSVEFVAVEFLDRCGDRGGIPELDKGESTRPIGRAVDREKDFRDLTHLCEQGFEICLRGLVAEVTDEDS